MFYFYLECWRLWSRQPFQCFLLDWRWTYKRPNRTLILCLTGFFFFGMIFYAIGPKLCIASLFGCSTFCQMACSFVFVSQQCFSVLRFLSLFLYSLAISFIIYSSHSIQFYFILRTLQSFLLDSQFICILLLVVGWISAGSAWAVKDVCHYKIAMNISFYSGILKNDKAK